MLKPHILFDQTKTSKKIKSFLDRKIKNISLAKCNLIIVVGGDGFMLSSLKKYNKYKKRQKKNRRAEEEKKKKVVVVELYNGC